MPVDRRVLFRIQHWINEVGRFPTPYRKYRKKAAHCSTGKMPSPSRKSRSPMKKISRTRKALGQTPFLPAPPGAFSHFSLPSSSLRTKSPTKDTTDLLLATHPIEVTKYTPRQSGPGSDLGTLVERIKSASQEPCVPRGIKTFMTQNPSLFADARISESLYCDSPRGWTDFDLQRELYDIADIVRAADACDANDKPEDSWRTDVIGPLLRLAFRPKFATLAVESTATAQLVPWLVPGFGAVGGGKQQQQFAARVVDYAITPATRKLQDRARRVLGLPGIPMELKTVNQTMQSHLRRQPVAISIEVKKQDAGSGNPLLQAGIWVASWYKRILILHRSLAAARNPTVVEDVEEDEMNVDDNEDATNSDDGDGEDDDNMTTDTATKYQEPGLISLPILVFRGPSCHLYFSIFHPEVFNVDGKRLDMEASVEIASFRGTYFGDITSVGDCYKLLAVLRVLGTWVETDFTKWWETAILGDPVA